VKTVQILKILVLPMLGTLAACGSDASGGSGGSGSSSGGGNGNTWTPNVFLPSTQFDDMCAHPRAGTSDKQGTVADENRWLRSWTHELYLWYGEVTDRDPGAYNSALDYFGVLKTAATTASGAPKDKFHFTYDTAVWQSLSQGGVEAGYGAEFAILPRATGEANTVLRHLRVAYTDPNTTAATNLSRGDEILTVDGADAVSGGTQAVIDTLNAGLFPDTTGESHTFTVRDLAGNTRSVTMVSASITHVPVPIVKVFDPNTDPVGYIQFNDHIATAEQPLIDAVNTLKTAHVTDLILDLRYNGGGYLDMASEVAYMIANTTLTTGQTFEKIVFNDKNPSRNPVTGETLTPTPFFSTSQGFQGAMGRALPNLNLDNVYIIVGPGTCSASESIINSLRGVNVHVYLIGSTTCGKPYGFYPADNCGTTYFTIQFRGENAANFGDYSDGFSPANQPAPAGTLVAGCSVADDFGHAMGDAAEGRIAAARAFRASNNQTCPAASGVSAPLISKASAPSLDTGQRPEVSKPAARLNRIIRFGT